ncbi:TPA: ribose-phosphate diphosphokinase [Candidatus Bathyarchaeota archaeon]|nr:ribose-phosphate diphosphokinase [Candidatus Bathyarchaeota archaeon]
MVEVLVGPASKELGLKVAQSLGLEAILVESKTFPDGESYVRIPAEKVDEEIFVIQSTHPPQDKHLMELFLMLDAAKDLGGKRLVAVVPYLAYARQDKRFKPGEAISVKTVAKLIEAAGATEFFTFNVHKEEELDFFKIRAVNLTAMPAIGSYLLKEGLNEPYVAAPDEGAYALAAEVATILKAECAYLEKERDKTTGEVRTKYKGLNVKGRDAVIVDDIISTGSTIANAAKVLKRQGARKVYAACAHPLLAEGAGERMRGAGVDEVLGTDCVPSEVSKVTVAQVLAEALKREL